MTLMRIIELNSLPTPLIALLYCTPSLFTAPHPVPQPLPKESVIWIIIMGNHPHNVHKLNLLLPAVLPPPPPPPPPPQKKKKIKKGMWILCAKFLDVDSLCIIPWIMVQSDMSDDLILFVGHWGFYCMGH